MRRILQKRDHPGEAQVVSLQNNQYFETEYKFQVQGEAHPPMQKNLARRLDRKYPHRVSEHDLLDAGYRTRPHRSVHPLERQDGPRGLDAEGHGETHPDQQAGDCAAVREPGVALGLPVHPAALQGPARLRLRHQQQGDLLLRRHPHPQPGLALRLAARVRRRALQTHLRQHGHLRQQEDDVRHAQQHFEYQGQRCQPVIPAHRVQGREE